MRYGLTLKFWARVFVDAASVGGKLDQAKALATAIGTPALTPQAILERREDGGTRQRFLLHQPEEGWQLALLSESFDLVRQPTTETQGSNMGQLEGFAKDAARILGLAVEHYGRHGHRVALVQEGLLPETDNTSMEAMRKKLLRAPEDDVPPFEWDWRVGHVRSISVAGTNENINAFTHVRRAEISVGTQEDQRDFDAIFVQHDVNTVPKNTRARFGADGVADFFKHAVEHHSRLMASLSQLVGVK
ncbi:MAG: hypothetical protein JST00_46775 [Deltaproteobacteria bacterium]|nr:hypothetical protein [Deltaproteobacteria bacterium]